MTGSWRRHAASTASAWTWGHRRASTMDLDTTWLTGMYVLGLVTGVTVTIFFVIVALLMHHRDRPRGLSEVMATLDRLDQVEQEAEPIAAAEAEYERRRREQMEHGF